jgi:uncharacterized membrane protein YbjE (DUF340 family)
MLICFGAAWPASIYKSYVARSTKGKSLLFMLIVEVGYLSGIIHKFFYNYDNVIYLYLLNLLMVAIDIALYLRNQRIVNSQTSS